jgi:type IV pilus assembly protein PilM
MASRAPVWGIDVGQCSLKAIKLQQAGDQVEMLAFDVVEHETILSQAETDATAIIIKAIETFVGRNDMRGSRVVVSVPGQQTLTRFTKMPPVEPKKIPDMVQYEASQQIPFDLDEVVWDYQVFTDKDSPDVEVGIFAIRKELIRNHLAQFLSHGIEPMMVQASPMASYNACQYEQLGDAGKATILLDMGALATDLIVAEGGRIWSRPVPIGGNRFTEALVTAFKLSFKKAEHLKRNAATSKHARQVFNAMRPVFADLVSEVQRSIGFYTSTHRDAHITRVVGMGNAFKLPGLQKFLQQNLQIEVDRLSALNKVVASAAQQSPAFADNVMSFSVAYGLAVQGLGIAAVNSNLLPLEITKTVLWRKKQPWFIAAAACLVLSAASIWVGNVMAIGQLSSAMGSLVEPTAIRASADQAESILSNPGSEAPVEKAAKVAGAAQALQAALADVERQRAGDIGTLRSMAKLPENNLPVPRIIDVIHRAFDEAKPAGVKTVKTVRDYLQYASQTERAARRDFWIERFRILYHASDAASYFNQSGTESDGGNAKAGWAIELTGVVTDPRPAKWIEETLIPALEKLGREPNRGFYVDAVKLAKVGKKTTSGGDSGSLEEAPPPRGGAGPRGGGLGRGAPGGGAGGLGGAGARGGGGMMGAGGAGGAGAGGPTDADNVELKIQKLKERYNQMDPVTSEAVTEDHRFVLEIIIAKGNTPANKIPDMFKPKKPDEKKGAPEKAEGA